ncbi:MAG: ester cyclase, partial [Chloroflexota bacterium]
MESIHNQNKTFINQLRAGLYDIQDATELEQNLKQWFAEDAQIQLVFPFEDLDGPAGLFQEAYHPLLTAVPDLERRDFIVMAGADADGRNWVGCGGHYAGVMKRPFLDIPPTQHMVAMRYHEFFCVEDSKIVKMQAIWDIPSLMMQVNAWPMTPSLGVEWPVIPGPASRDGIITAPYDETQSAASLKFVEDMLIDMGKYPLSGGPEVMRMPSYWHPKMMWYGPAGIGSMRRISGFRDW